MKKLISLLVVLVLALVLVVGVNYSRKKKWDRALSGPYKGRENVAEISGEPISKLSLGEGSLEIYYLDKANNPIVVCRSPEGDIISQASVVPSREDENGKEETAYVRQLELIRPYSCTFDDCEGLHVLVECDWEWGGKKKGLLSVHDDLTFKEVWLSP